MILDVKNLSFGYHRDHILFKDVNFSVDKGEIFSILGSNGIGKSTLLNCIANLLTPLDGEIMLNGVSLKNMNLRKIAKTIGYVPQIHDVAYAYEVRDYIVMGRAPYLGMFAKPSREDFRLADMTMEELGISHLAGRAYTELSGGERQQVSIARAIVQQPDIIILDEPTNHLDYGNQLRMIQMIRKLARNGYGIIITSHMPDHVLLLDGNVGILGENGHLQVGTTREIMNKKNLEELYHVEIFMVHVDEVGRNVCVAGKLEDSNEERQTPEGKR